MKKEVTGYRVTIDSPRSRVSFFQKRKFRKRNFDCRGVAKRIPRKNCRSELRALCIKEITLSSSFLLLWYIQWGTCFNYRWFALRAIWLIMNHISALRALAEGYTQLHRWQCLLSDLHPIRKTLWSGSSTSDDFLGASAAPLPGFIWLLVSKTFCPIINNNNVGSSV